jgi:dTMP kinase
MLIVIEGIDGSGKSTLAKGLALALKAYGLDVLLTREPGDTRLGKSLRPILQQQPIPISPVAEFLLFAADRAQHFHEVIVPALRANKLVISDRMGDSSLVYQGYGRGIDKEKIKMVNEWAMQYIKPNLILYLRVPLHIAQDRLLQKRNLLTEFEKAQTLTWVPMHVTFKPSYQLDLINAKANLKQVYDKPLQSTDFALKLLEGFETLYKNRDDVITLDGTQSPQHVIQSALEAIQAWTNKQTASHHQIRS